MFGHHVNRIKGIFILMGIMIFLALPISSALAGQAGRPLSAPAVTKQSETTLSTNANTLLNGLSFQQGAVETYNGWQYAVWYSGTGSTRRVNISRRQLPSGGWQNIEFTDYNQTVNDDHNTISMGISTQDGAIHLSFDHHNNTIRYRKSVAGLATNPGSVSWTASQFGAVQSTLGGISVTPMTYPRFIRVPNGRLLFETRIGSSGDGDEYLYEYNNGTWSSLGKFIEGGTGNGYLHGMNYGGNRLHVTWTWRETPDWTTNHDLMYLYSDDHGRTWKNNAGTTVSNVTQSTAGVRVWTIGQNTSLLNQEGQTVDSAGRVHVLLRSNLSGSVRYEHYYRDTNGTWARRVIPVTPANLLQDRGKIVTDSNNNAYAILPNLRIASASAASNYTDWAVVYSADNGRFAREPLYDIYRLQSDGILSIFYKGLNNANLYLLNFQLNTGTSSPATPTRTPTPGGPILTPTRTPTPSAFPVAGTYYRLINRNSVKVADVSGASTADGGDVIQWTSNGATSQQWNFVSVGSGYYKIVNRNSGKMMDVSGGSTADGGNVIQWTDNGGTNQQWSLTNLGNGYYRITNRKSGKVLDVSSSSTADGGNILQWTSNGGNNQQWQIVP
jgi:hypothetical protein